MKFFAILFSLFVFLVSCVSAQEPSDEFIAALIQVESSGNDRVIGDQKLKDKAYGCLQIRRIYVLDVNQTYGTKYKPEDCLGNRELSIKIFKLYMRRYWTEKHLGRQPTPEDCARLHNGGPTGPFEGGAINKRGGFLQGKTPEDTEKKRQEVLYRQEKAKEHWRKVKRELDKVARKK